MPKAEGFQDLSLAPPHERQELWRWLHSELRAAIVDGRLKAGARMPSTRCLARQYNVSRGTVTAAFDQLHAEGYTMTQVGAGTFVASELPDDSMSVLVSDRALNLPDSTAKLSDRARMMIKDVRHAPASHSLGKAFRSYEPAIDLFPVSLWSRIAGRVLRRAPRSLYGQGDVVVTGRCERRSPSTWALRAECAVTRAR